MNIPTFSRRRALQALAAASTTPWLLSTRSHASSCDDGIVRMGAIVAPDSLNPFATWGSFWPTVFTYDFLVAVDAQRHEDRRGFAKSWSVAEDGLTWTMKIWPGMQWSDGMPATAHDAAFTYAYLTGSIGTADELNAGWNNTDGLSMVESITAVDDETLVIVTKEPTRWPADNLAMIVPEHVWKDVSYADALSGYSNNPPVVGTGPMVITEFEQGQYARFTPNEYFRTGQPGVEGMIFRFFNASDPIVQGLRSGDLDYGVGLTPAQWEDLADDPDIVVGEQAIEQQTYLAFNTWAGDGGGNTPALRDPAFRDALGYAIDHQAIVDRALRGHADPGVGAIVPAATDYFSEMSDIRRSFDLEEAARRLDAAGYVDSNNDGIREDKDGNDIRLELIFGTLSGTIEIPIATVQLIGAWFGEIGLPVSVTQLESGALQARMEAPEDGGGDWDLLVASSWLSSAPTDLLGLGNGDSIGNRNHAYWSNERFDALLADIGTTVDLAKSQELVDEATRLFYQEAPYIFLCYPFVLDARRDDCFTGWGSNDIISMWGYFPYDRLKTI